MSSSYTEDHLIEQPANFTRFVDSKGGVNHELMAGCDSGVYRRGARVAEGRGGVGGSTAKPQRSLRIAEPLRGVESRKSKICTPEPVRDF